LETKLNLFWKTRFNFVSNLTLFSYGPAISWKNLYHICIHYVY